MLNKIFFIGTILSILTCCEDPVKLRNEQLTTLIMNSCQTSTLKQNHCYIIMSAKGCMGCIRIFGQHLSQYSSDRLTFITSKGVVLEPYKLELKDNFQFVSLDVQLETSAALKTSVCLVLTDNDEITEVFDLTPKNQEIIIDRIIGEILN